MEKKILKKNKEKDKKFLVLIYFAFFLYSWKPALHLGFELRNNEIFFEYIWVNKHFAHIVNNNRSANINATTWIFKIKVFR